MSVIAIRTVAVPSGSSRTLALESRSGLQGGALVSLFAWQIAGEYVVADREDATVAIGAQTDVLDRVGAVRRDVEDLLPRQRDFYRPLELPRCDRRQDSIGIDPELAAEP